MKILDEETIGAIVLTELYYQFINDEIGFDAFIWIQNLIEKCNNNLAPSNSIGKNASFLAIHRMESENYLRFERDDDTYVQITSLGARRAQSLISEEGSTAARYWGMRTSDDNTHDDGTGALPPDELNETDDAWEPIPVDRSSSDFATMMNQLEAAKEEFRRENGFASQDPDKKAALLDALENGYQTLRSKVVTRAAIQNLLLSPLRSIARIFGNAALAEAARITIAAIKNYFGL